MRLQKYRAKKAKIAEREVSMADFIPYLGHWNAHTVLTEKKELMQVIKVGGFSFETADDEDVDIRKDIRNMLFKGIGSGGVGVGLYFHTIRRAQVLYDEADIGDRAEGFAAFVENEWRRIHITRKAFVNELYITIIRKPNTQGAAVVEHLFKKMQQATDKANWERDMLEAYEELQEMTSRITTTLRDYNPKLLGTYDKDGNTYSEILRFLASIINCADSPPILATGGDLSHYIANHRLYFGSKAIEVKGPLKSRYAGIVSVKEYGPNTHAGVLDSFLQMPFECIITQSFEFTNRSVAINQMQLQQNRMIQAEDKALSQIAEITQALDMAMSGDIGFGGHHLTVLCIDENMRALESALSNAIVELGNGGIQAIREKVNMEPCFWAQLPGNFDYAIRRATINTLNLSAFASMHNFPTGQQYDNHWGEAVTVFDTTSGTPFYFNFHLRDVGHTTIIGPTGAGKTVLMNFLCAQAQKYRCRLFFFDKDRGAEIFLRAIRGVYTVINPSAPCGFNPLQLDETSENRTFLMEWLKLLVTANNESLTADDIAIIDQAISGNYKLDPKDRRLQNIAPFFGLAGPGSLAGRLGMWYGKGSHAKIFDNENDHLDFSKASTFGFEMAELLKDPVALGPCLSYVFHRINISLDGIPTMIILDEAWALIDNDVFAPKIKDWLKVLRKLNAFVVFATQSVEDASKSAISDTLIQQTATQIFLPNLKATDVYRTAFMLSEREFQLIKMTDPGSRFFLVKQGNDAVVSRVNLAGMDDIINVLSGRAETVRLLDKIREKVGDDPDDWLPLFWKQVKEIE